MKMKLNHIRYILALLLIVGEGILILNGFTEAVILGAMIMIGIFWLVTEGGTHASYTIRIGQMLEVLLKSLFGKPKQPEQVTTDKGEKVTIDKVPNIIKLPDTTR